MLVAVMHAARPRIWRTRIRTCVAGPRLYPPARSGCRAFLLAADTRGPPADQEHLCPSPQAANAHEAVGADDRCQLLQGIPHGKATTRRLRDGAVNGEAGSVHRVSQYATNEHRDRRVGGSGLSRQPTHDRGWDCGIANAGSGKHDCGDRVRRRGSQRCGSGSCSSAADQRAGNDEHAGWPEASCGVSGHGEWPVNARVNGHVAAGDVPASDVKKLLERAQPHLTKPAPTHELDRPGFGGGSLA